MRLGPAVAGLLLCGLAAAGCSSDATTAGGPGSSSVSPPARCVAHGGARCPGPAPVTSALVGHLYLGSRNQLRLFGDFRCGGQLRAKESARRVVLTYVASRVRTGGMACAKVRLSVALHTPVNGRPVIDGVTGQVLRVGVKPNA